MKQLTAAAIQMVSGRDLQANLDQAEQLISEAVKQGANFIVLPEVFAMYATAQQVPLGQAEAFGEAPIQAFLQQQASSHQIWIVAGSIPYARSDDENKVYSASMVFNEQGQVVAQYNKIHLFDVDVADHVGSYRESDTFIPGDEVVVVDTPFGRLGLAVCYDVRFPEFFRMMFAQEVDFITLPSAFTKKTGDAHWLPLLRARAIENQCYLIAANQGGDHGKNRQTSGHSLIVNGWGEVLAEAGMGESVAVANIDVQQLHKLRATMPIKQHQRFSVVEK